MDWPFGTIRVHSSVYSGPHFPIAPVLKHHHPAPLSFKLDRLVRIQTRTVVLPTPILQILFWKRFFLCTARLAIWTINSQSLVVIWTPGLELQPCGSNVIIWKVYNEQPKKCFQNSSKSSICYCVRNKVTV